MPDSPARRFGLQDRFGVAAQRQLRVAPPSTRTLQPPFVWPVRVVGLDDVRVEERTDLFAPLGIS